MLRLENKERRGQFNKTHRLLHAQFTSVAIVLESENNSYICKLHV